MERLYRDRFYTRWTNRILSKKIIQQFDSDPEYHNFLSITKNTKLGKFPKFNIDANFEIVWKRIQREAARRRKHRKNWCYGLTVLLLLLFGYLQFWTLSNRNPWNEKLVSILPEKLQIYLTTDSIITSNPFDWNCRGLLSSEGKVMTNKARLSMRMDENFQSAICYESKD